MVDELENYHASSIICQNGVDGGGYCNNEPATKLHECPFETELNDNYVLCNCCKDCEESCAMEI
jgi:hypothetical protein